MDNRKVCDMTVGELKEAIHHQGWIEEYEEEEFIPEKKVYCQNCRYYDDWDRCKAPANIRLVDSYCCQSINYISSPPKKNKNNDCPDFKKKPTSNRIKNFFHNM